MQRDNIPQSLLENFFKGMVIPALPLALDENRRFDETRQRALIRYYLDAGAGGIAVGVHSTQFEIREPAFGLFKPILKLAAETASRWDAKTKCQPMLLAGVCGDTPQAIAEASLARELGYHAALLSLKAIKGKSVAEKIQHCRNVAEIMPIIGFYMQTAVGGEVLSYAFWRQFAEIENVIAIKMAPFNRYQTFDVVRAVADSGRAAEIALYTGNDDNIVADLVTPFDVVTNSGRQRLRIVGGLLGHWGVWTQKAVMLLDRIHDVTRGGADVSSELLASNVAITDANAAFFDAANGFAGCIPGIHEVLRRQGLLKGTWCLNPDEKLSPGQAEEIDRVYVAYPELNDDAFVREHLASWLNDW